MFIVIPFLMAALLGLGLGTAAWRRVRSPGSLAFALTMLAIAIWLVTVAGEASTAVVANKVLWAKLSYLAIAWIGPLWLLFTLEFANPIARTARRLSFPLALIPVVTIALVMTNELHGLFWTDIRPFEQQAGAVLQYYRGPWFWVFAVYSYSLLALAAWNLASSAARMVRVHRSQAAGLAVGMALPWAASIAYLARLNLLRGSDPTPYGFALGGLIIAWVLFRNGLFHFVPLAHEAILENITDGFLVLDERSRLVEINAAGCRFLQLEREKCLGQPAESVLGGWPELIRLLREKHPAQGEISVAGSPPLVLDASSSEWRGGDGRHIGRLLILHDVTRRNQAEQSLRESEQLYRLVVNAAPVGITLIDKSGMITFTSPRNYDLYSADLKNDYRGHSPLLWVHPDDRSLAAERMKRVIQDQVSLDPQEYRLVRVDGSVFWGEITSAPIINPNGDVQGMVAMTRDVSERKSLQTDLQGTLERRTLINDLLHILYRPHDMKAALGIVLERVGGFVAASRIYLCQDSPDGIETSISSEWCMPGISPRSASLALVRYAAIPSWQQQMEAQSMVVVHAPEELAAPELLAAPNILAAPEDLAEFLDTWGACSLAAFPIYGSEERLYGFLAVDHCAAPHAWSEEDLDLLRVVSRIVSGAVAQIQSEAAGQRQRALAEALHDTASALNSTLNLDEVLDRILSNLERVVPKVAASMALVDEEGLVHFVRWRGYSAEGESLMRTLRMRVDERQTYRWMAETGLPIIIGDTWLDKRWTVFQPYSWIRSYAGVPILIKGRVAGFINLDSDEPDFFAADLSYSLSVFADQAAVAIENAHLYDAAQRRAEEMIILNRIAMNLTAGLETNLVLLSLFDECRRVLPVDVFSVALYDPDTGQIEMPLYYNDGEFQEIAPRSIASQPGLTGEVIRQRRMINLPDTLDPATEETYGIIRLGGKPARSYVGVPLFLKAKVVGVIAMQNFAPHAYSPEQVRLLEMIATQAAIAVQNARLYDQMKQMAITDTVTGLNARRHFSALGRSEVERARRYNRQVSVLMVDIDHFKRVNDTYGHNAGDQVLQAVADVCHQALRATDIVGRWGGEEFAVVLPEADRDGAALIAERIRRMMSETLIPIGQDRICLTVSIGVATLGEAGTTLEELIDQADRAMYLAKDAGRNQVCFIR